MPYMASLNVLLKIILNQYFLYSRCAFLINDEASIQINLPLKFSILSISVQLGDSVTSISGKLFQNYGCQVFVLNVENPAIVLSKVEQGIKSQNESFCNRSYIIIDNGDNLDNFESELFKIKEMHFISNLLIISLDNQVFDNTTQVFGVYHETYGLRTHGYTGSNKSLQLNIVDKWLSSSESFFNKYNLFPNKMVDHLEKTYEVGFFQYLPYIFYEWNNQTKRYTLQGLEGVIITEFFKKQNLSMEPSLVAKDYWGDVFDNGSMYGLRGILYEDKVDVAIAFFATDRMYRYYGMTVPILRIGITCLVPAPKLMAGWLTPLNVYSKLLWKIIFLGYIFIILSIYIAQFAIQYKSFANLGANKYTVQLRKFGEILFTICTQYFGTNGILKGYSGTIFIALTLFVTFFLSRTYESGLASIMTIPSYENSIETASDFLNSNISWGGIQVADWLMHWENDDEERYRRAYKRYLAAPSEEMLKNLLSAGNFGLLIERISDDQFHFPFQSLEKSRQIKLMTEDIHWEYSVLLLRKSSSLIPLLDKFILTVNEAGMINYWLNQAAAKVLPQNDQKELKYLSQHYSTVHYQKGVQLRLAHVAGVFGIVAIGNLLALLVFFAELLYSSKCHSKNILTS